MRLKHIHWKIQILIRMTFDHFDLMSIPHELRFYYGKWSLMSHVSFYINVWINGIGLKDVPKQYVCTYKHMHDKKKNFTAFTIIKIGHCEEIKIKWEWTHNFTKIKFKLLIVI